MILRNVYVVLLLGALASGTAPAQILLEDLEIVLDRMQPKPVRRVTPEQISRALQLLDSENMLPVCNFELVSIRNMRGNGKRDIIFGVVVYDDIGPECATNLKLAERDGVDAVYTFHSLKRPSPKDQTGREPPIKYSDDLENREDLRDYTLIKDVDPKNAP